MLELKIGHDCSLGVDDDHSVMIAGPVESGVVRNVFPFFHAMSFLGMHRGAVVRQPNTRSLAGCCSLRRWDGRARRTGKLGSILAGWVTNDRDPSGAMRPAGLCLGRKSFSPPFILGAAQLFTAGCGEIFGDLLASG